MIRRNKLSTKIPQDQISQFQPFSDRSVGESQQVSSIQIKRRQLQKRKLKNTPIFKKIAIIIILMVAIAFIISNIQIQKNEKVKPNSQQKQEKIKTGNQVSKQNEKQVEYKDKKVIKKDQKEIIMPKENQQSSKLQYWFENKFWLFHAQTHNSNLNRLYYQNNKYFAALSGFEVKTVNVNNAKEFLSTEAFDKLLNLRKTLEGRAKEGRLSGAQAEAVLQKVALLAVTAENGGVMVAEYGCLTQTFEWLRGIKGEVHARRGKGVDAEFFAFYDPGRSSPSQKENIPAQYEVEKYMRLFPGLQSYFIVSKKKARLLTAIVDEIIYLLLNPSIISSSSQGINFYGANPDYVYADYFHLAVHKILQKKQKQLDEIQKGKSQKDKKYRQLAVDYYGVYYITELASIRKIWALFGDMQSHVQIISMTLQTMQQLYDMNGPFFQYTRLTPQNDMNRYVDEIIAGRRDPMIKGSFLQRILFPESNKPYIVDNPEKQFVNATGQPWTGLSKKIWVYWHSGIENAQLSNQLCVQALRKRGEESGFELHAVSEKNLHQFLDQQTINRIDETLRNSKVRTFPQSKPDLVRLALLIAHGGVYFDVSFAPLTNLDWLVNISQFPSQYIFNRYGHQPKVFMHFHPNWGGVFDWKISAKYNTKVQWQLPLESNFIAAQKGNEFIKSWFQLLISFYGKPYHEVRGIMKTDGLIDGWNSEYLMPMDTIKCVISRKQKQIKSDPNSPWADASDYYKIWSISGMQGVQKYRDRTGIQSSHSNPDNNFVYRYSEEYVQGFIGKNFNLIKTYGQQNNRLSDFIARNRGDSFAKQAHPQSLFMKYMYLKG